MSPSYRLELRSVGASPRPDRQQLIGGRHASADARHEEDRVQVGRSETQGAGSHAQHTEASAGDCLIDLAAGALRRRAEEAAVSRASQLDAKSNQSATESNGGSEAGSGSSSRWVGRSEANAGDYGGSGWASSETDANADFRRRREVGGKDGERVRTAHGTYSQKENQHAQRVWQVGKDPGSGKPNRDPLEVYAERPADSTLLLSSIQMHQQRLERIPRMVAADAKVYSRENEKAGQALSVRWMSVPNKKTTSGERKLLQHERWFRRGQKWGTGSEGRIRVLKRRHGLRRCLDPGLEGMRRWVGLGVIADNVSIASLTLESRPLFRFFRCCGALTTPKIPPRFIQGLRDQKWPVLRLECDRWKRMPQNARATANLVRLPSEDQKIVHAVGFH
jgi:hypothetical protein